MPRPAKISKEFESLLGYGKSSEEVIRLAPIFVNSTFVGLLRGYFEENLTPMEACKSMGYTEYNLYSCCRKALPLISAGLAFLQTHENSELPLCLVYQLGEPLKRLTECGVITIGDYSKVQSEFLRRTLYIHGSTINKLDSCAGLLECPRVIDTALSQHRPIKIVSYQKVRQYLEDTGCSLKVLLRLLGDLVTYTDAKITRDVFAGETVRGIARKAYMSHETVRQHFIRVCNLLCNVAIPMHMEVMLND